MGQSFEAREKIWKAYMGVAGLFVLIGLVVLLSNLRNGLVFLSIGLFVGGMLLIGGRPKRG